MRRHAVDRPFGPPVFYTALQESCPDCDARLPVYQDDSRRVQGLEHQFWLHRRDKRCSQTSCPGSRPLFRAPRDARVMLPGRMYGLDVTLHVGERHLADGVSLAQITRDLNARGLPLDQRHTGRVFRDFMALASLVGGDDAALRDRLRAQGGIVLMCDGVQFDDRSPVLYMCWDAVSGSPLFGERKPYRGEEDLIPLLEGVRDMDVPVIGIVTDKEKGLVPAVQHVFPDTPYQFCHTHFLKNCAKPLEADTKALGASVRQRADEVRKLGKQVAKTRAPAEPGERTAPSEEEMVLEVCELVRVNSRVSGKAPLAPAELHRHERLEQIRAVVDEVRKKKPSGGGLTPAPRTPLDSLHEALAPTWHDTRTAGRVRRGTEILRSIAHELSTSPDRQDRPATAAEAQRRFEAHLSTLVASASRKGLGAATGRFVDDLAQRYSRYGAHLFPCFDDRRIPATTNELEGFFGSAKRAVRHAAGCGSTTNSVVTNLGADALLAFHQVTQPGAIDRLADADPDPQAFIEARAKLTAAEAPAVRQRSMLRSLPARLARLREAWLHESCPDG